MSLDILTEENYQQTRSVEFIPKPAEDIGVFKGAVSAPFLGAKRAWDIGAESLADVASPYLETAAEYWLGKDAQEWIAGQTEVSREIVRKGQRTPQEMGVVANVLYQAGEVITSAAIGGAVGGVPGAMAAAGSVSGRERFLELKDQGVDDETARNAAYVAGGTMAVGVGLAPYYGIRALTQVASGVGINVGLGAADRYGTNQILSESGYAKTAEHYKTLDGMAVAADAVLGAAFPFAARVWRNVKTSDIDAALVASEARQADTSMPVLPGRTQDIDVQNAAIDSVKEQMFADGKSAFDIVAPNIADGAPNAKLIGEQMIIAKNFDEIVKADPELSAFRDIRAEDFDATTRGTQDAIQVRSAEEMDVRQRAEDGEAMGKRNAAEKTAAESATKEKVAEEFDSFLSQEAARIAAQKPEGTVSLDGEDVRIADIETRLQAEMNAATQDSTLIRVATACALSHG